MVGNNLYTEDSSVSNIVGTVTDQIDAMNTSKNQIMTITQGVEAHFQSLASNAFGSSMNDWSEKYAQIITAYNAFLEEFQGGHNKIDTAHDDAKVLATNLGDHIFNGLNPR